MKKIFIIIVLMFLASEILAGDVYKWTDEKGNVHFSAQPPTEKTEALEVKKYKGVGIEDSQYTDEEKETIKGFETALKKVDETKTALNCSSAMSNLDWQFETMFSQARRNLENGSITEEQYNFATDQLKESRQQVSYSDCQSAAGVKRSFYECMSNSNNHLIGCGEKYNF